VIASVVVVVTAAVYVTTVANGILADQTPDGKHRLGRSAATAAPATVVSTVVGVASAAGTGPRAQIHDYGDAMVTGLRSNHRVDGASGAGPDGTDDIYRGRDADTKKTARECTRKRILVVLLLYNIWLRAVDCTEIITTFSLWCFRAAGTKTVDKNVF